MQDIHPMLSDYSERVSIETAKLRDLNSEEFKSYRVEWRDLSAYNPNFVEICVKNWCLH